VAGEWGVEEVQALAGTGHNAISNADVLLNFFLDTKDVTQLG